MKKIFLPLLAIILITCSKTFAQENKIDSVLQLYGNNYQPEKAHLHFDKYMYNKGETIWFKAYIMQGFDLSIVSKNFYVDFFSSTGKLLKHFVTPVFQSTAKGQFDIPSNYTGEFIQVKAYTQWMLNFDTSFLYVKNIPIAQKVPAKLTIPQPFTTLTFFPEGGDLVEGLNANVGFLSVNQIGMPVNIKGIVTNSKGKPVDTIATQHDGMGSFNFDVEPNEKYTVKWQDPSGKQYSSMLPAAKPSGINMQVDPSSDKSILVISRTNNVDNDLKTINIVAYMNQHLIYRSRMNLQNSLTGSAEIPTQTLPTGIMQITLFNAKWIPIAERIVFVNNHNHEFITDIVVGLKNMGRKEKNAFQLYVSDTLPANLSVSVTDADLPYDKSNNIISQLLLCSDIKGYVPNPTYYFDSNDDSINYYLDLVMLTHGWRKFNWEQALHDQSLPQFAKDSDYIQIKGKAFLAPGMRFPPDQQVILFLQGKDSSKQTLFLPVKDDGSFLQKEALFFDSVKIFYKLLGKGNMESRMAFSFQNGFLSPQKSSIPKSLFGGGLLYDSAEMKRLQFFAQRQADLEKLMQTTTLANVTVESRVKSATEILDQKYSSGLFSGGDAYQFDLSNDPRAQGGLTVFDYLQGQVAGLQITQRGADWALSWRGGSPDLFLNEMPSDASMVSSLSMSDIAYIKVFRPPFFGAAGGGSGGAIAIYTKNGSEARNSNDNNKGLDYAFLEGYSRYKQFYSPDYSTPDKTFAPDSRTTLYWNPYILTEPHNRRAKIEFYNNDITKKFRIIVQGFNSEGKLTYSEKIVE